MPGVDGGLVVRYFNALGATTSLQWRYVNGRQLAFAYIGGDAINGDRVWMDWSRDGGLSWIQCGPSTSALWAPESAPTLGGDHRP